MERHDKRFEEAESANSIASSLEKLATLNSQLLAKVQESNREMQVLERRLQRQKLKDSHTGIDTEDRPFKTRNLLELLKEITSGREQMQVIEEKRAYYLARDEALQLIEETVQDRVEAELKSMLVPDGTFSKELSRLVDQRLKALFSGSGPVAQTTQAGPGRGKRGKTHKKFSASLEESLFGRVKSLPGQFSGHLSSALEAYLSVVGENEPE